MLISILFLGYFVTGCPKRDEKQLHNLNSKESPIPEKDFEGETVTLNEYDCAYGGCIYDETNQPNGNKLCSINYPSIEIASSVCETVKCDKIAQYNFKGKGSLRQKCFIMKNDFDYVI